MTRIDQAFLRSISPCDSQTAPAVVESLPAKGEPTEPRPPRRSRVSAPHFAIRGGPASENKPDTPQAPPGPTVPEANANHEEAPPSSSSHTETPPMAIEARTETQDILPLPSSQSIPGRGNSGSAFVPSLEVDAFLVPPICRKMVDRLGPTALAPVAQTLASAARRGCCLGGFLGWGAASGCTTTALSTALLLADRGKRVLVVDAADNAALTSMLGLDLEQGWDTAPDRSLRELVIRSLEDRFDLLPKSTAAAPSAFQPDAVPETQTRAPNPLWRRLAELTTYYAFILIDLGGMSLERDSSTRISVANAAPAPTARKTTQETDLASACDVLFYVRDARRRLADLAPSPGNSPTLTMRPRSYIIDNFSPNV